MVTRAKIAVGLPRPGLNVESSGLGLVRETRQGKRKRKKAGSVPMGFKI